MLCSGPGAPPPLYGGAPPFPFRRLVMARWKRVLLAVGSSVGIVALGVALLKVVPPDERQKEEMRKIFSESNPEQFNAIQRQNALIMEMLKEAAETNENVAQKPFPRQK